MDKKEKAIAKENIYSGTCISLEKFEVICPNGNTSFREIIRHPGGACILPILDEKIVMEKQYRFPYDEVLYELPAGKINQKEEPLVTAKREFQEETGFVAETWENYGLMYPTCGYTDEVIYLFVATGLTNGKTSLDFDENIDLCFFTLEECLAMIDQGIIKDAKTIILLLKYARKMQK